MRTAVLNISFTGLFFGHLPFIVCETPYLNGLLASGRVDIS